MQPIRIGMIGVGTIGARVARRLTQDPRTRVVFVCDTNEANARQMAEELGSIPWTTDYKQLIQSPDVDLVYVGTPPRWHRPIVLDVIAAGKPIMSEKPLALTLPEAAEMTERVQQAGLVNHVNLTLPYDPNVREFGRLVGEGFLGQLRRVDVTMYFTRWPRLWQSQTQNNFIGKREQGGPVREVGPHLFDVVLRNFGPVTRVLAQVEYPADPEACEVGAFGLLELASGVRVTVNVLCGMAHQDAVDIMAYGTDGTLGLRNWRDLVGSRGAAAPEALAVADQSPISLSDLLYGALREGETGRLSSFAQGLTIQAVLDAWERSAESGVWESVRGQF